MNYFYCNLYYKDLGSDNMKKERKFIIIDTLLIVVSLYIALLLKFDFKIEPIYMEFFWMSIIPVIAFTVIFNILC